MDAGPYDFDEKGIDWTKVLQGDRFFALLQIRALTYVPEYAFSVPCQNQACRARVDWELNLSELPVRKLSDESREVFINGNRFETTLPDMGNRVWFKLLTGEDERKLPMRNPPANGLHGIKASPPLSAIGTISLSISLPAIE